MPARSFAIDCWATRLLFWGMGNPVLGHWFEHHRCAPRGHNFLVRWLLGADLTTISFECSHCHQIEGTVVRTPFDLFRDPISDFLKDGWPTLLWDSPIATWQLGHRAHVEDLRFTLARIFQNGRIMFALVCPCGQMSGPSAGWPLSPGFTGSLTGTPPPHPTPEISEMPRVVKSNVHQERLVRHRASGRIYKLPAFTVSLDPVEGESNTLNCLVENLWFEFDRFYGSDDSRRTQSWHERLTKE